jgi:lysylphosphatidylglycerol synthetase-like protein (DUF2156 family)
VFEQGDPNRVSKRPTVVAAAVGLLAVAYLVGFAIKLSSGWVGKEAAKNRLRHPDQSPSTAHGIAIAAVVIVIVVMCALVVLAIAIWRGSRPAEFAASAIVVLVAILALAGASRRPSSIGEWATVAVDFAVVAITGIGLRMYHRTPT